VFIRRTDRQTAAPVGGSYRDAVETLQVEGRSVGLTESERGSTRSPPPRSEPVAEAVRLVRDSGLPNETNAMFTNVEGDWDEVLPLIKACVMKVAEVAPRVSVVIKIDHRPGVRDALRSKVEAIDRLL